MTNAIIKISKTEWYRLGGFKNTDLFRKANKRGIWSYYRTVHRL